MRHATTDDDLIRTLRPLLAAEVAAEAAAAGADAEDLEQGVWTRLLEHTRAAGPPAEPARWLRHAVRAEVRDARRLAQWETPYDPTGPQPPIAAVAERAALEAEARRALLAVAERLPGRCPALVSALLSRSDLTYREIASALGMSQGSLGPVRSRCLECLRRMLTAEVAAARNRGVRKQQRQSRHDGGVHPTAPSVRATGPGVPSHPLRARAHRTEQGEANAHGHERDRLGSDRPGRRADPQTPVPLLPAGGRAVRRLLDPAAHPDPG